MQEPNTSFHVSSFRAEAKQGNSERRRKILGDISKVGQHHRSEAILAPLAQHHTLDNVRNVRSVRSVHECEKKIRGMPRPIRYAPGWLDAPEALS